MQKYHILAIPKSSIKNFLDLRVSCHAQICSTLAPACAKLVLRLQKYLHVSGVSHVEIFGEVHDDVMLRLVKSLWARQQRTRDCEHAETRLSLPLPVVRSWHRIIGLYTIYETVKIPAGIARLGKALANMD